MVKEGSIDIAYHCLKEFRFKNAQHGEPIIRYGEMGNTFYIIVKGAVDVYIPFEVRVSLTNSELARLIQENRSMILEVNRQVNFSTPHLTIEEKLGMFKAGLNAIQDLLSQ